MAHRFHPRLLVALTLSAAGLLAAPDARAAEPPKPSPAQVDMAAVLERAKQYTTPGKEHELLRRFLGEWQMETRLTPPGLAASGSPEKGTMRGRWLMEGRWLFLETDGTMMGMAVRTAHLIGYDRMKMSYVTAQVNSVDTALTTSEGDVDPKTGSLLTYGTLDEYLTGEHDKMVKYAWRFVDDNTLRLEVHDLPIGESDNRVLEFTFRRKSGATP